MDLGDPMRKRTLRNGAIFQIKKDEKKDIYLRGYALASALNHEDAIAMSKDSVVDDSEYAEINYFDPESADVTFVKGERKGKSQLISAPALVEPDLFPCYMYNAAVWKQKVRQLKKNLVAELISYMDSLEDDLGYQQVILAADMGSVDEVNQLCKYITEMLIPHVGSLGAALLTTEIKELAKKKAGK